MNQVAGTTQVSPEQCSDDELAASISDRAVAIAAQQRDLFRFVREHDRRRLWQRDGCRNMGQWLAARYGISATAGQRWTNAAHALEQLPVISDSFERGLVSLEKVVELARFATPETERDLLCYARRASLSALRRKADLANRPALDEHKDDEHARFLDWRQVNDSGAIYLEALFPAHEGAIVTKALRRIADDLPQMPALEQRLRAQEVPDWFPTENGFLPAETVVVRDGLPQRLADALVVLATDQLGAGGPEATVVVSTTLEALQGDDHSGCEIEGVDVVHPEVARRIACDARLQFVLRDAGDEIARGIGSAARLASGSLRRELMHRDGGCTFPGCGTRRYVQAHHIVPWPHGPTQLDNLTMVCRFHHKLVHEHGWRVELDERQRARWFRRGGARYDPEDDLAETPRG